MAFLKYSFTLALLSGLALSFIIDPNCKELIKPLELHDNYSSIMGKWILADARGSAMAFLKYSFTLALLSGLALSSIIEPTCKEFIKPLELDSNHSSTIVEISSPIYYHRAPTVSLITSAKKKMKKSPVEHCFCCLENAMFQHLQWICSKSKRSVWDFLNRSCSTVQQQNCARRIQRRVKRSKTENATMASFHDYP
ncbi:saxitoxin and tetrodotoxin-binding protein 2-like [Clarias magur]|uniref:Saxitoxin and tetrodotoxin-binding protein 2-like n=1 Tax=Clarias magur TaxID=1594786 RepID=A0A8J4WSP9_CLAMG|nr:saxitoxin and tetrodotoxin-binding protein 2-like [Clarias magur]